MKTLTTILFFAVIVIISCKKESNDPDTLPITVHEGIAYPDSIYYGKNILSYPDSSVFLDGIDYEIGAVLENHANLSLVITNYPAIDSASGHSTLWFYTNETGWSVGDYNDTTNTQKFISSQSGKIDSQIIFSAYGQIGKCKIDFYENGSTITRTKHFSWH
jgi:hypothetical protein